MGFEIAALNSARGVDVKRARAETRDDAALLLAEASEAAARHLVEADGWAWEAAKRRADKALSACCGNIPRRPRSESWCRIGHSHLVLWIRMV